MTHTTLNVKVEFWSEDPEICANNPPYPSKNSKVNWLRNMPPYISGGVQTNNPDLSVLEKGNKTIKTCPGINDHLGLGYIIPLWTDLIVRYDCFTGNISIEAFDKKTEHHFHDIKQLTKCPVEKTVSPYNLVLNLHSPWKLKVPEGYSTYILHPYWLETDEYFTILPGIVDNDTFHTLNLILKWNKLGRGEHLLKKGTPLAQIFPFKREKFSLSISSEASKKPITKHEDTIFNSFLRQYRRLAWSKKDYS